MDWIKEPQKIEPYDHCSFHGCFSVTGNDNGSCSLHFCVTRFCLKNYS